MYVCMYVRTYLRIYKYVCMRVGELSLQAVFVCSVVDATLGLLPVDTKVKGPCVAHGPVLGVFCV